MVDLFLLLSGTVVILVVILLMKIIEIYILRYGKAEHWRAQQTVNLPS